MASNLAQLLPDAKAFKDKMAAARAEEATKLARQREAAEVEKRSLIEQLSKPSGVSDEEAIQRALKLIERAVSNGLGEVLVYRFSSHLCTDGGRAINQQETGWENTLTGTPKEIFQLWARHFRPRGYKLRAEILDFPAGKPGDVGLTLNWS